MRSKDRDNTKFNTDLPELWDLKTSIRSLGAVSNMQRPAKIRVQKDLIVLNRLNSGKKNEQKRVVGKSKVRQYKNSFRKLGRGRTKITPF